MTPLNGARTMARAATLSAAARVACACGQCGLRRRQVAVRVLDLLSCRHAALEQVAGADLSRAWRLRSVPVPAQSRPRCLATSAVAVGISNRTSRSPAATRSPSPFGSSAMRAGSGATTTSSAPGAAVTIPAACTTAVKDAEGGGLGDDRNDGLALHLFRRSRLRSRQAARRRWPLRRHTTVRRRRIMAAELRWRARGRRARIDSRRRPAPCEAARRATPAGPEGRRRCRSGPVDTSPRPGARLHWPAGAITSR